MIVQYIICGLLTFLLYTTSPTTPLDQLNLTSPLWKLEQFTDNLEDDSEISESESTLYFVIQTLLHNQICLFEVPNLKRFINYDEWLCIINRQLVFCNINAPYHFLPVMVTYSGRTSFSYNCERESALYQCLSVRRLISAIRNF